MSPSLGFVLKSCSVNDRMVYVPHVILLVDDSEIVVESTRRWLERSGYEVVVASNCSEARAAAAERHFSAHIIDLQLSDGTGVNLALWLRHAGHQSETIFYSGHSVGCSAVEHAQQLGHVVTKGENPNVLLRVLEEAVDRFSRANSAVVANAT